MAPEERKSVKSAQPTREWALAEYQKKTQGLLFTKDFLARQEALMHDRMATVGERVMAWILRRSWGEYVLYAMRDDGEPAYQRDCAKELGINKRRVSDAVAYFEKRRYLEIRQKRLYPVISPVLASPPPEKKKSGEYGLFVEQWKVTHSSDFQELEVARSTVKRITKVLLSEYKKSKASRKNGGVSLLEKEEEEEKGKSSSSAVISVPLNGPEKAEEEEGQSSYQKFKAAYPRDHFDEAEAKPSFEAQTPEEQTHILGRLEVYKACARWKDANGQFIKFASNFLKDKYYDNDPPAKMKPKARANDKPSYEEQVRAEAERRLAKYGSI